jgi:hypothetical protein
MSKLKNKKPSTPRVYKKSDYSLKKDSKTGLLLLSGPAFTKEDIAKAYPDDPEDRVSRNMRRSVGL